MRTTKLSLFCDYVIEAGWLAAVITVPLFFNVYSSRVFEPDKLTLLRSIALLMAFAWLIKTLDTGLELPSGRSASDNRRQSASRFTFHVSRFTYLIRGTPLVLPTLLLVAVYFFTTATSIAPRISFWGSYQRLQGTYTMLAYVIIFLMILQGLRTREQLDRLITALILTSLPVALYGLIQHYGLDPLPWLGDVTLRVASSMGNSIFVAAYLIMVVPLTLLRLLEGFVDLVQAEDNIGPSFIQSTGYLFIFLAQLLAIFFSQSRGPWLGLLSAVFVFGLLWAVTRDSRRLVIGIIGLALLGAAGLVVLNLPNTPLEPIKEMPYIGRLGRIFETDRGTGRVRVLIWEGATRLVTADPVRTLIGYGPETMHIAYNPYYPPDLAHYEARNASPDRSHNETFDALVITGLIGFAAYLFLFISLFYYGLTWLGLVQNQRERNLLLGLIVAGGILTVLGFQLLDGTGRFFGVALPAGMILGLFAYLIWVTRFGRRQPIPNIPFELTLIALLSAIIGHFVEIHFGIAIAATRTLFWTYAAVMVVVGYLVRYRPVLFAAPVPAPARPNPRSRRGRQRTADSDAGGEIGWPWDAALPVAGIAAVILLTIVFDYVTNPGRETNPFAAVWHTLVSQWENNRYITSPATLWLVGLVWLLTGFLGLAPAAHRSFEIRNPQSTIRNPRGWWIRAFIIYGTMTLAVFLVVSLIVAARLAPRPGTTTLDQALSQIANHVTLYYVALFATLLAVAGIMAWRQLAPAPWWSGRWPVLLSPLLAVVVFIIIDNTNLDVVQADIMYKQGWNGYHLRGQYDAAITTYLRTLNLQPDEDYYYLFLGKAYLEKAQHVDDSTERERLFEASRQALQDARRLNPRNPDHTANLARLHQQWGQITTDPARRQQLWETALDYHRQATELAPNAAHLYNEWALTLDNMGRFDDALGQLRRSLELDAEFVDTYIFLGEVYRHDGQADEAIAAYQKAAELKPERVEAHRGLALMFASQERLDDARQEAEMAAQLASNDPSTYLILADIYRLQGYADQAIDAYQQTLTLDPRAIEAYSGLALAYEARGNLNAALDSAQQALSLAPNDERLQALVENLKQQTQ